MKRLLFALIICFLVALAGCAKQVPSPSGDRADQTKIVVKKPPKAEIEAKVAEELKVLGEKQPAKIAKKEPGYKRPKYDIPITINQEVLRFIDYFQTRIPHHYRVYLSRSGRFKTMMTTILKSYGLPQDLLYLAMIESGFSCRAYSRAHAVGPWQFIRGTGKRYGLKINYWVDERRDPVKATHAAARYLKDLHDEFGSWYLAAAGYNAGEGKIRRALKRYDSETFWEISQKRRRYLKNETKNYVPKMIAAAIIAKEPEKYGFENIKYQRPMTFDTVSVHPRTSLSVAAKLVGIKTQALKDLNPELKRWSTPPKHTYRLRIPKGLSARFNTAYAKLAPKHRAARLDAIVVKIHRGDTLGGLAREYGVKVNDMMAMNPHLNPRRLRIGQKVAIPPAKSRRGRAKRRASLKRNSSHQVKVRKPTRGKKQKVTHVVRKGESLWIISQAYRLDHKDIMRWNGMRKNRLMPGAELVLYLKNTDDQDTAPTRTAKKTRTASKAKARAMGHGTVYVVRSGQSLYTIGKRYGATPSELKRWNNLPNSRIKPGQRLVVAPSSSHNPKPAQMQMASVSMGKHYTVRRGDTLWEIGQRFKTSPYRIKRLNKLNGNRITPGDVLRLR